MNVSLSVVSQIMRDLGPVGDDARRRAVLRRHLYYGKSPSRVCILMVVISLSSLGLRSTDVLMDMAEKFEIK